MRSKKHKAVTSEVTALKNNLQNETYRKSTQLSNFKLFIGELLILGNKQRREFWWLFDSKLIFLE